MKCKWTRVVDHYEYLDLWETDCGNCFELYNGTPAENGMQYCCYCGKALEVVIPPLPANEETEDEDVECTARSLVEKRADPPAHPASWDEDEEDDEYEEPWDE